MSTDGLIVMNNNMKVINFAFIFVFACGNAARAHAPEQNSGLSSSSGFSQNSNQNLNQNINNNFIPSDNLKNQNNQNVKNVQNKNDLDKNQIIVNNICLNVSVLFPFPSTN